MQLSMLIGKQILSPSGEVLGYVKGAYLSRGFRRLSALACVDGEEEEFFLPARAVRAVNDAVIAGNARLSSPAGVPFPVGKAVFTEKGESLGAVCDLLFGEGETEPMLVALQEGVRKPLPAALVTVGETVIFGGGRPRPSRPSKRRAKNAVPPQEEEKAAPAIPMSSSPSKAEEAPMSVSTPVKTTSKVPMSASSPAVAHTEDRCNLLGRQVRSSLFDADGAPIILAGERITPAVLSAARKSNKILQLTVSTFTNLA